MGELCWDDAREALGTVAGIIEKGNGKIIELQDEIAVQRQDLVNIAAQLRAEQDRYINIVQELKVIADMLEQGEWLTLKRVEDKFVSMSKVVRKLREIIAWEANHEKV